MGRAHLASHMRAGRPEDHRLGHVNGSSHDCAITIEIEKAKEKFSVFLWLFARLFVTLASPKVLPLEKAKEKFSVFLWLFARLFVPLQAKSVTARCRR